MLLAASFAGRGCSTPGYGSGPGPAPGSTEPLPGRGGQALPARSRKERVRLGRASQPRDFIQLGEGGGNTQSVEFKTPQRSPGAAPDKARAAALAGRRTLWSGKVKFRSKQGEGDTPHLPGSGGDPLGQSRARGRRARSLPRCPLLPAGPGERRPLPPSAAPARRLRCAAGGLSLSLPRCRCGAGGRSFPFPWCLCGDGAVPAAARSLSRGVGAGPAAARCPPRCRAAPAAGRARSPAAGSRCVSVPGGRCSPAAVAACRVPVPG